MTTKQLTVPRKVKTELVPMITSPAQMIREAIDGKASLEQMDKLLALQEKWEANQAKKAYHKAMAAFKADPPSIGKDRTVDFKTDKGRVNYNHASLANVTKLISASLSKHGLSATWRVSQEGAIRVTCKITHEDGHSEETTLSAPSDQSGSKNPIQAIGSTITYLERYTLLAMTGLATHEDDDARNASPSSTIKEPERLPEATAKPRQASAPLPSTTSAPITAIELVGLEEFADKRGIPIKSMDEHIFKRYGLKHRMNLNHDQFLELTDWIDNAS